MGIQSVRGGLPTIGTSELSVDDLLGEPPGKEPETRRAAPTAIGNGSENRSGNQQKYSLKEAEKQASLFDVQELLGGATVDQTLDAFAEAARWVAWRQAPGAEGKRARKVPYASPSRYASSTDPATWSTRAEAEALARSIGGELGLILGDYEGAALGGVDLDSCYDPQTGALEPWASEVIERFASYAEISPSGRGVKVFFAYDPASLDTRAFKASIGDHKGVELYLGGRYFAVTAKRLEGAPAVIRTAPASVVDWLRNDLGPRLTGSALSQEAAEDDPFAGADLLNHERAAELLDRIPAAARDDRDIWLKVGMALHHESGGSEAARLLWQTWSAISPKFDQREQDRTWKGFGRPNGAPIKLASVVLLARQYSEPEPTVEAAPPSRLSFLSPEECVNAPARGYTIKGLAAPGDVGCIFGPPGAGKSLLAPHLGFALAQGREAFGMRTKAGPVMYVAAEDPHGMRSRIAALRGEHGDALGFTLVEGVSNLLEAKSADLAALLEAVKTRRPSLIVVDTLALAFPGLEENSAEGMGRVVAAARKLAETGATVILVHHGTKADGGTPRGHSVLNGALDFALQVERDEEGIVRAKLTKNRNGPCDRDIAFTIATRTLGEDEDGDPITAALVNELAGTARRSKLSPAQEAALSILLDIEREKAADDPDFGGSVRVPESDWRMACIQSRALSGSESEENRKRAFRRVVKDLAGQGRIVFEGDYVRSATPCVYAVFDDVRTKPGQDGQGADKGRTSHTAHPAEGADGLGHTPLGVSGLSGLRSARQWEGKTG
ncbi:AAA family ATPase [Oceanicaulis alexandrii]|uniref:AAA family ATPase n=1 Tax=Oceanicaulis alexandrii TaxID=153233 RepID=UPI003B501555